MVNKDAFFAITANARASEGRLSLVLLKVLNKALSSFAFSVATASAPENVIKGESEALRKALIPVKHSLALPLADKGFRITDRLVKLTLGSPKALAETGTTLELTEGLLKTRISEWIYITSEIETKKSSALFQSIYRKGLRQMEKTGRGFTPKDLERAVLKEGLALNKGRAKLMASTISNYSHNAGASQAYKTNGISKMQWISVLDEVTGEWDAELNGTTIPVGSNFVESGQSFIQADGSEVSVPFDIPHPPLHPHCRCTITPVVE